jgi:hypothetical protein
VVTTENGLETNNFTCSATNNPTFSVSTLGWYIHGSMDFTGINIEDPGTDISKRIVWYGSTAGTRTMTTGGIQLPTVWINTATSGCVFTLNDNCTLYQDAVFIIFSIYPLSFSLNGKSLTASNIGSVIGVALNLDSGTINCNYSFQVAAGSTVTCEGTTFNLDGATYVTCDSSVFTSTTSWSISKAEGATFYHTTVRNSTATSTNGAMKVIIFPDDPPGTGDGGGNGGWTFINARIKSPPTYIVTPTYLGSSSRVLTPPTRPGA